MCVISTETYIYTHTHLSTGYKDVLIVGAAVVVVVVKTGWHDTIYSNANVFSIHARIMLQILFTHLLDS